MTRLLIVVEGQTEEAFVKELLGPHLDARGVYTTPMIVASRRDRHTGEKSKGGGRRWSKWHNDIRIVLKTDASSDMRVTTLFDLYGLPRGFPGVEMYGHEVDSARRADLIEAAVSAEFEDWRLVPYVQRHEFEALVLVGLEHLELALDPASLAGAAALRSEVGGMPPEDVNDGEHTAPSKRLIKHLGAAYDKVTFGPLVTAATGLPRIRAACPRFDAWVSKLEALATT